MLGFRKASAAYDPTMTAGLRAWWDPDVGVTNASGKASAISDKAGNGYAASQATAGSQPTITASAINSHTALTYAANQALDTSAIGLTGNIACTIFACVKPTSGTAGYAVFGFGQANTALGCLGLWLNATASGQVSIECSGNNGARFAATVTTSWQVFVIRKPAGALSGAVAYQNGTNLGTPTASASTPNVLSGGVRLGGWAPDSVTNLYSGQMFAAGIYNGDIGDAEAVKLSNYYKTALLIP